MNLAWLVAIFSPHEIADHPNFEEGLPRPEAELAAILLNRTPPGRRLEFTGKNKRVSAGDEAIDLVYELIFGSTTVSSRESLTRLILDTGPSDDIARIVALSVVLSAVTGELDEYDTADRILTQALGLTGGQDSPEKLCRVVLLQQKALRRRDFGFDFAGDVLNAARLLDDIVIEDCTEFELNGITRYTQSQVIQSVYEGLRKSVWSLFPNQEFDRSVDSDSRIPSRSEQLRQPRSLIMLPIAQGESRELGRFLADSYKEQLKSAPARTIGKASPDLYFQVLAFSLLGNTSVYESRKEMAMLRIVRHMPDLSQFDVSLCLRTLRLSNADAELRLLIRTLVYDGPLNALVTDARHILDNRTDWRSIRAGEFQVLSAAAELLSTAEADRAFNLALEVLREDGPTLPPGNWQSPATRAEPAWVAAADIAANLGEDASFAKLLLDSMANAKNHHDLWDRTFSRVIPKIHWGSVGDDLRSEWVQLFEALPEDTFEESRNALTRAEVLEASAPNAEDISDSSSELANALNFYLRREEEPPAELREKISSQAVVGMREVRLQAKRGEFRGLTIDPSTFAAFLAKFSPDPMLIDELLKFLTDRQVDRFVRSHALEILSDPKVELPDFIVHRHRESLIALITSPGVDSMPRPNDSENDAVFLPALTFAVVHELLDQDAAMRMILPSVASSDHSVRKEVAGAISTFASVQSGPLPKAIALQLSFDRKAEVRAAVVPALIVFAQPQMESSDGFRTRLQKMLYDDGILVPLTVLRHMARVDNLVSQAKETIAEIRSNHPSRRVRESAARA
ncbi:hypothetical protein V7968_02515 [Nocardia vulneris]|uniref:hypothetical protein n=1 Tax=Nocardia vulneris TaxID=1141657 RepID=UPI0030CCFDF3